MKHHILIVDDIAKNIQVLGSLLAKDNYAISYATHASQALAMVETEDYDLILLDIMMPELDGYEVCRRIKMIPGKKDIPIIFLTARIEKQDIVEGFNAGAVDYITKPFNSAELKARVLTHVQLKIARDRIAEQNSELREKNSRLVTLNRELHDALERIKTLEGIVPICCICKNIRDDQGYWARIEEFIAKHSDVIFSHGICPDCAKKHYPDVDLEDNDI